MNRHYSHFSKDHLGNIRSVVRKYPDSGDVTEVQKTHYYPFGGIIADISTGTSELMAGSYMDGTDTTKV